MDFTISLFTVRTVNKRNHKRIKRRFLIFSWLRLTIVNKTESKNLGIILPINIKNLELEIKKELSLKLKYQIERNYKIALV